MCNRHIPKNLTFDYIDHSIQISNQFQINHTIGMSQIVKLNVGGTHFDTTYDTLIKSEVLRNMLNDSTIDFNERIFINRSGKVFEDVFGYLLDDSYSFPKKYINELEYFSIPYTVHEKNSDVISKPIYLFCRVDKCNNRCDPKGPSYCKEHRCVIPNCNDVKINHTYCTVHEQEFGWCTNSYEFEDGRFRFCGRSRMCSRCSN